MPRIRKPMTEEQRERKKQRQKQYYLENKEKIAKYHAELHRSRSSDPDYMRKLADRSAEWRKRNHDASKIQNKKRRESNPELARAQSREWFSKNHDKRAEYEQNRRAKKRNNGGKLSIGIKQSLYEKQKGKCACCGNSFDILNMHMDHIMPLSLGGFHSDNNIQLLCQPCNQSKYSKHPIDFMQSKGFLL